MRIAVIAPTYLPSWRANTIQVMKMAQAFLQLGHQVRLAVPGTAPGEAVDLAEQYGLQQVPEVDWLPAQVGLRRYDYGWRAVGWARKWQAEVIYTRLPQAAALSSWMGRPTIYEIHDLPQGYLGPVLLHLYRLGRGARRMVVISSALEQALIRRFNLRNPAGKFLVAPDGVDLARYEDLPEPGRAREILAARGLLQLAPETLVAGYTGNLYPGRGREMIMEMAARRPEVIFLLVGGDPEAVDRQRTVAAQRGLMNVIVTGFVPNARLPLYQAACNVLLMPYQERVAASSGGNIAPFLSPLKLFEYLASGRAILSSDLPVLREILDAGCAELLPPDNVGAWIQALDQLASNPEQRQAYGVQARQAAQRHTWHERAARILEGL